MMLIECESKNSQIAQTGLFTKQSIKKGQIISFFIEDGIEYITENKYNEEQNKDNLKVIKGSCRYIDKYFVYYDKTDTNIYPEEFFNHSFEPNVLYHCGICFALRDISINEELTINYEYLLSNNDKTQFIDSKTCKLVNGLDSKTSLLKSTKELLNILT